VRDTPLLTSVTLQDLVTAHIKAGAGVTLLTATVAEPYGYGRVLRGRSGVTAIVEEKDATRAQKKIREVNSGIYCFEKKFLLSALGMIGTAGYYLPDTISIAGWSRRCSAATRGDHRSQYP
jgi:bifunctional UDP-N-acetylglucosamine pyrophosphorylase/glucosamine-1-phosphate N-acetyltransferase